jgi:methionine sulfoxide reductase catalytic subunit
VTNQRSNYIPIRSWNLPDSAVTPEHVYIRRREFLRLFGFGVAATVILPAGLAAAEFPDSANPEYKLNGVKLTPEDLVTSYNNFYEWGTSKDQPKDQANHGWNPRLLHESSDIDVCGATEPY